MTDKATQWPFPSKLLDYPSLPPTGKRPPPPPPPMHLPDGLF